jgi:hydrogenase-4 component B
MSFFVRSFWMLTVFNTLQVLFFVGTGSLAVASLLWWTFIMPDIVAFSPLRMLFLLILSIVAIGVTFYSTYYLGEYLKHKKNVPLYIFLTLIFFFSMIGIVLSNEMITFLTLWELMSLASYFLVIHESHKKGVLWQGARYFIITHIGFFAILFAFLPFVSQSGSTFFDSRSAVAFTQWTKNLIFILALIGFGSKAWIFPIHLWLPKAHPIAPSHISALMSGFMVKIPVLFLLIFVQQFFANQIPLWRGALVLALGAISAFIGIFYASIQNNIKRILAYSTIENIGIIFVWLGLTMIGIHLKHTALITLWMFATLYHTFNHAVFKSLLFCTAGSVIERTGTWSINQLGGLIKKIPWVAWVFLLWSWAIIWLPPLNGFNSEIVTIMWVINGFGIVDNIWLLVLFVFVLVIIGMMSAAAVYCFVKTFAVVFLGNQRDTELVVNTQNSVSEKVSYARFVVSILGLAVLPGSILWIVNTIVGKPTTNISLFSLSLGDTLYTPRVLLVVIAVLGTIGWMFYNQIIKKSIIKEPWNCGYPAIVPKTQYSWNSFIQPLRRVFAGFFWEERTVLLEPKAIQSEVERYYKKDLSSIHYSIAHTYRFDMLYEKLLTGINNSVAKLLSTVVNGKLHVYIAYTFLTLIVAVLVFYFMK